MEESIAKSLASHADGEISADRAGRALPELNGRAWRPRRAVTTAMEESIAKSLASHADGEIPADRAGRALVRMHIHEINQ